MLEFDELEAGDIVFEAYATPTCICVVERVFIRKDVVGQYHFDLVDKSLSNTVLRNITYNPRVPNWILFSTEEEAYVSAIEQCLKDKFVKPKLMECINHFQSDSKFEKALQIVYSENPDLFI